ncbi:hypothetical protein ACFYU5_19155 [Nocardia aobensis]|uniref:Tail assembly chaperone n=1 Tax=Nocardia aobensis TaxID=257277 RepID=A0ABW6P5V5_9NOCA
MPAPRGKRVDTTKFTLEAFEAIAIEALGEKPGLTLELKDGSEIYIPHPAMVDDDRLADIERVQALKDLDEEIDEETGKKIRVEKIDGVDAPPFAVRLAQAILGPADHARFISGGGKSALVMQAWKYLADTDEDEAASDPKPEK